MTDYERGFAEGIEAAAKMCEGDGYEDGPDVWGWHSKDYASAIRALQPSREFVCVPREPTAAMIFDGIIELNANGSEGTANELANDARLCYEAMIRAAEGER